MPQSMTTAPGMTHRPRDQPGRSRGHDHDVGAADLRGEVDRPAVADGHGGVLSRQQETAACRRRCCARSRPPPARQLVAAGTEDLDRRLGA